MDALTLTLGAIALILLVANGLVARIPKKSGIKVAFLPPSALPQSSGVSSDIEAKLDAHIHATHHKINALFGRVEALEKSLASLTAQSAPVKDETWIETVPLRNRKKN